MFDSQAAIHCLDSSCLSMYPRHYYGYTQTCTTYDTFPNLDLTLDDTSLRSIWHLNYVATGHKTHNSGHITHNLGRMTHNIASSGCMTQNKFCALSIRCHYCLMPSCMTGVSSKWQHNVTACYRITDESIYLSHQCHIMPAPLVVVGHCLHMAVMSLN